MRRARHGLTWHIIPVDHRWFTCVCVADIMVKKLSSLQLSYPAVSVEQWKELQKANTALK